jgi:transcriptional regulator with XRE-family HTH domain/SOS-response transcriptional repressor LexA
MYASFPWTRPASLAAFGTALRRQREALDLTLDAVANLTGISKPYLSNIETARTPGPASEEKLRRIAAALQLPVDDLLTGADWLRTPASIRRAVAAGGAQPAAGDDALPRRADGTIDLDRLVPGHPAAPRSENAPPSPGATAPPSPADAMLPVRNVPLINRVAAGKASEFTDLGYPAGIADQYVPAPDLPDAPAAAAFALRVVGDSMTPVYREGEILIVGPGAAKDGDDCVVRLGELEHFATTFKRIFFVREEEGEDVAPSAVRLVPLNPAYAERVVPLESVTGIYPLMYRLLPARGGAGAGDGTVPPPARAAPEAGAPEEPRSFTSRVDIEHD